MRTFISLNLNISTKRKISKIKDIVSNELLKSNPDSPKNLKWEDESKYHITLFFIGETNPDKLIKIETGLTNLKPFSIQSEIQFVIKNINAFPNFRYPRVLILDVVDKSGNVNILSDSINSCLHEFGFKSDKPFHPHVTLARVRRDRKINLTSLNNFPIQELNFTVSKFRLMESQLSVKGAEHILIRDFHI